MQNYYCYINIKPPNILINIQGINQIDNSISENTYITLLSSYNCVCQFQIIFLPPIPSSLSLLRASRNSYRFHSLYSFLLFSFTLSVYEYTPIRYIRALVLYSIVSWNSMTREILVIEIRGILDVSV